MPGQKWTEKEITALYAMTDKGVKLDDMVVVLESRSKNSILSKLRELGFPSPKAKVSINLDYLEEIGITEI